MDTRTRWIPLGTAFLMFLMLTFSMTRGRRQISSLVLQRDSVVVKAREMTRENRGLLAAGDTLPSIQLRGANGETVDLRALPEKFKYLYFGRADCPGCIILRPFIDDMPRSHRDSLLIIAFHPDSNVNQVQRAGADFSWIHGRDTRRRFVLRIPTLIVRGPNNRVLSVAHGSLMGVASLFDLFGHLSRSDVSNALDSAIIAARREGITVDTSTVSSDQ